MGTVTIFPHTPSLPMTNFLHAAGPAALRPSRLAFSPPYLHLQ